MCAFYGAAMAGPSEDIIAKCWTDHDHPAMTKCVRERAQVAQASLDRAEREVRQTLAQSSNDRQRREQIQKRLDASTEIYQTFRATECAVLHTLASTGNGAAEARWSCEAVLDEQRVQRLQSASWWLK